MSKSKHCRVHSIGLDRGFSEEELKRFLSAIDNERHHVLFELMAYFGLRVSEVVRIKLTDIDFNSKILAIHNIKGRRVEFVPMSPKGFEALKRAVRITENGRENPPNSNPYLFSNRNGTHIDVDYIRKLFKKYLYRADLATVYAEIPTRGNQCKGVALKRRLYRLSTHSLRHYFITTVYNTTLDPMLTQRLGRHKDFESTQVYININRKQEMDALTKAFQAENDYAGRASENQNMAEVARFMEFYKLWKQMNGK